MKRKRKPARPDRVKSEAFEVVLRVQAVKGSDPAVVAEDVIDALDLAGYHPKQHLRVLTDALTPTARRVP